MWLLAGREVGSLIKAQEIRPVIGAFLMNSTTFPPIPRDTANATLAVFGRSNCYVVIGDRVNELFAGLSLRGSPHIVRLSAQKLAALYLITIFQHWESLPDHLAVDALRERIEWKYALHLPLNPHAFAVTTMDEFRKSILTDTTSKANMQTLLDRLAGIPETAISEGLIPDAGELVTHVCRISQLANIWKVINEALEVMAIKEPQWLLSISLPYWFERYSPGRRNLNLRSAPQEQEAFARSIGGDGFYLLEAISGSDTPGLTGLPEVATLRKVWNDQFEREMEDVLWRKASCAGRSASGPLPASTLRDSPAPKERRHM